MSSVRVAQLWAIIATFFTGYALTEARWIWVLVFSFVWVLAMVNYAAIAMRDIEERQENHK